MRLNGIRKQVLGVVQKTIIPTRGFRSFEEEGTLYFIFNDSKRNPAPTESRKPDPYSDDPRDIQQSILEE